MINEIENYNNLLEIINIIKNRSHWSKKQNIYSIFNYLHSEIHELEDAIFSNDKLNIMEETADVMMLLLLFLLFLEEIEEINRADIISRAALKLKGRYPDLFPENQLILPGFEIVSENRETKNWIFQKSIETRKKYCFCINKSCSYYAIPNSEKLVIRIGNGNWQAFCKGCKNTFSLSECSLFYGAKIPKTYLLNGIKSMLFIELFKQPGFNNTYTKTIKKWVHNTKTNPKALANILKERYGIEQNYVLDYFEKY